MTAQDVIEETPRGEHRDPTPTADVLQMPIAGHDEAGAACKRTCKEHVVVTIGASGSSVTSASTSSACRAIHAITGSQLLTRCDGILAKTAVPLGGDVRVPVAES